METIQFLTALALGVASQLIVGPARADDADTKIWPDATQTVPQFIVGEMQDARRFREDLERAKSILDNAYPIDPAHSLIPLGLAMVEGDEQTAAFLCDYDLKRLPESCSYTKDLDPKEVLKLTAEMCTEEGDEERAQEAREKLKALENPSLKKAVSLVDPPGSTGIPSLSQKASQEQKKADAVHETFYPESIIMPPPSPNPDPEPVPANAVRLIFEYEGNEVRLVSQHPVNIAITGFDIAQEEQPGHFVDTRDAAGRTLARVPIREAFTTSVEVFPEHHGEPITRVDVAQPRGAFTVVVPASKEADHISVVRVAPGKPEARMPGSPVTSAVEGKAEVTELGSFPLTKEGRKQ